MSDTTTSRGRNEATTPADATVSKTLANGLRVLEVLARHPGGLAIGEIAELVEVHRTVAHRLVHTLELHRLVRRDAQRRLLPGPGLVWLAEAVEQDLRAIAGPILEELAERAAATAYLVVDEGDGEVRALAVVEPRNAEVHVAFRAGQAHPINRGSAGMAILATLPPQPSEREEVTQARKRGYAVSRGEVITTTTIGVATGVPATQTTPAASVGVSVFDEERIAAVGELAAAAATRLATQLGTHH